MPPHENRTGSDHPSPSSSLRPSPPQARRNAVESLGAGPQCDTSWMISPEHKTTQRPPYRNSNVEARKSKPCQMTSTQMTKTFPWARRFSMTGRSQRLGFFSIRILDVLWIDYQSGSLSLSCHDVTCTAHSGISFPTV